MAKKATAKKAKKAKKPVEAAPEIKPEELEIRCGAVSVLSVLVRGGKLIVVGTGVDGSKINQSVPMNGRTSVDLVIS